MTHMTGLKYGWAHRYCDPATLVLTETVRLMRDGPKRA